MTFTERGAVNGAKEKFVVPFDPLIVQVAVFPVTATLIVTMKSSPFTILPLESAVPTKVTVPFGFGVQVKRSRLPFKLNVPVAGAVLSKKLKVKMSTFGLQFPPH